MPFSHFAEEFFELCRYSLINAERTPYRERNLDFIVRFVVYVSKHQSGDENDGSVKNLLLVKTFLFCAKVSFVLVIIEFCWYQANTSSFIFSFWNAVSRVHRSSPSVPMCATYSQVITGHGLWSLSSRWTLWHYPEGIATACNRRKGMHISLTRNIKKI